jgi:DNA-binding GntR family transcriptional regulator
VGDYRSAPETDLEDHRCILQAIEARDAAAAQQAIRANILRYREQLTRVLESESSPAPSA